MRVRFVDVLDLFPINIVFTHQIDVVWRVALSLRGQRYPLKHIFDWENWRNPKTGDWERTFAIITVPSNDLVAQIHDRMPAILKPSGYDRWLSLDPDAHDLLFSLGRAQIVETKKILGFLRGGGFLAQ